MLLNSTQNMFEIVVCSLSFVGYTLLFLVSNRLLTYFNKPSRDMTTKDKTNASNRFVFMVTFFVGGNFFF